ALLRASEISDSARLQNAFGGKAERETLDLTASEAWNRTVVEASEPAEPSFSIEHRANLSLQDEIQRIEHETWAREFHIKHSQFGLFSEPEERLRIRGTLQLFSWYGDSSVVKTLGHRGTDVNAKNSNGDTALHFSSMAGNFETTLFLMEQGARINAKNKDGSTPLHEAALYGHEAIVELLIRNGAKVNAEMNDWKRPLNLANEKDHPETARVLKAHGATEKPSWFWNSKIILGVSVILAVIVWSFVIYRDIYRRFDADRDITITPKKDPDVILMPGSESASDIGTKMLERR
ncbi:ankyrin repeat domain-containing protein, partial [Candidatus Micrarchaeota archaeon]|nr:ankyrin repeat domain-containing protein [Candidatus Micrarchaeota archaeon]